MLLYQVQLKIWLKGEDDRLTQIMNAIPVKKRGEVVLSAMNDVFKGTGVNQQSLSPTQFTKWYQTINRSPEGLADHWVRQRLQGALMHYLTPQDNTQNGWQGGDKRYRIFYWQSCCERCNKRDNGFFKTRQ